MLFRDSRFWRGFWLGLGLVCLSACRKQVAVAPPAQVPGLSAFHAPFDLTWDLDYGIDANGVPLNAKWAAQLSIPMSRPVFRDTCGDYFHPAHSRKGTAVDTAKIAACTTQTQQIDTGPDPKVTGPVTPFLCPARPFKGHLNFGVATYTGVIQFAGWSSNFWPFDDDINFTLHTPCDAGLTALGEGLHMELRASETLDQFVKNDWWTKFNNDVHDKNPFLPSNLPIVGKSIDQRIAVVTGLVGVDGVHGGYTESHPVYAMAVRSDVRQTDTGVEETWDFFLRNHGTEGDCSRDEHHWSDSHGAYYVQLPWPAGATSARVTGEPRVWSYLDDGISGAALEAADKCSLAERSDRCTLVRLDVPNSNLKIGAYGRITLAYPGGAQRPLANLPPPAMEFEGGKPEQIKKRLRVLGETSTEIRQKLPPDMAKNEAMKAAARESERAAYQGSRPIPVNTNIQDHVWRMAGDHREGSLRADIPIKTEGPPKAK